MPSDTLFGEATQALQGASQAATGANEIAQKDRSNTMQAGTAASSEVGAGRRQASGAMDQQKLLQMKSQLDQAENMIEITPQIATGLVKNTGDIEWMKATGQKMRSDVLLGMYTNGMNLANAKKADKITQTYDKNGKIRHAIMHTDENGNVQQILIDEGMTPEQLHPKSLGKDGDKDPNFKKNQQFIKSFEKARSELSDPIKVKEMQKLDPDGYKEKEQFLKDHQDQYDQLIKGMGAAGGGTSGGATPPAPSGGAGKTPEAPFDADSFINNALSQ